MRDFFNKPKKEIEKALLEVIKQANKDQRELIKKAKGKN